VNTHSTSIRHSLMRMMLFSSGAVIALMTLAFCSYEVLTFRHASVQKLQTLSEAIASNCTSSLAFANKEDAISVLTAFKADPHIIAAALYDTQGGLFATYPAALTSPNFPALSPALGYKFDANALVGVTPVLQHGARLGTLYVKSDLRAIYASALLYGALLVLVMTGSLALAYLIARRLQERLLKPISALADTVSAVSMSHDYTVRASGTGAYEFDVFTDAFNQMLTTIQESEGKLRSQLARLNLLQHITRAIGDRQDLHSIFLVVLNTLEDSLPIDFACFLLHEPRAQSLTVETLGIQSSKLSESFGVSAGVSVPIDNNGLSRCIGGEFVYEPDIAQVNFPFPQRLATAGLRSLVLSPLNVENEVFGVLACARRLEHGFTSSECEFLKQLSGHVALASHQTRLYGALQRAYDDLRQSQHAVMQQERLRALGQMASGIAHDINNAISPVSLYTESLLEREPNLSERARSYLTTIQRAIEDVARTVARMREFYREREAQLTLERVDLNRAVRQVVELTKPRWGDQLQQRGVMVELGMDLTEPLPQVMGAEHEIRDALTNLIFNAVDAMPAGGKLVLRTRAPVSDRGDDHVTIEVIDNGIGMDDDTRRRCLEPFYTTKGERGTGLGLAMVYGMIQRHSAEIEIESTVGLGTTVRLRFPADTSSQVSTTHISKAVLFNRRLRILLVDDDPLLIKSLQDTLQQDGHVIEATHGGQAGIDAFAAAFRRQECFDVVITDLGMPHVDGRRVAAEVRMISGATPVILLTGWGQRLIAANDTPEHVSKVLSKPPRLQELRAALAEVAS
jgi:signal transduction histidine kinase/ActR/RegA family two-component response regulator